MEVIIVLSNVNYTIMGEQLLLKNNISVKIMPLPSAIKAGCGLCLRIDENNIEPAEELLEQSEIQAVGIYDKLVNSGTTQYRLSERKPKIVNKISFLSDCTSGGCGAKIGPGELSAILEKLPKSNDPRLIVGYDSSDDAAVYQIDDKQSMISTVDFFSPMVENPRDFGRIAAANALSDVYAMGGKPAVVLNLICFPEKMSLNILEEILAGGSEKITEAGAVIGGGHSIYDKEAKYGLSVTGFVDNEKIIRNSTPKVGHKLILTKALGTGIVMAASRGGMASEDAIKKAVESMAQLNKYAAEKMTSFDSVSACTDITGFGLLAHLLEMCSNNVSAQINTSKLPVIPEAVEYANEYLITAAGQRNRNYFGDKGLVEEVDFAIQELLFDPQTSGGLLICIDEKDTEDLLAQIKETDPNAQIIGTILPLEDKTIVFKE